VLRIIWLVVALAAASVAASSAIAGKGNPPAAATFSASGCTDSTNLEVDATWAKARITSVQFWAYGDGIYLGEADAEASGKAGSVQLSWLPQGLTNNGWPISFVTQLQVNFYSASGRWTGVLGPLPVASCT
jgi:hypothetical protein